MDKVGPRTNEAPLFFGANPIYGARLWRPG